MAGMDLTPERLRELLRYDPDSGSFTRLVMTSTFRANVGDTAGWISGNGYRMINILGRQQYAHRLAWLYMNGEWPTGQIDHINGIRHDNRFANLRCVTQSENVHNRIRHYANSKTGILGVHPHKGRYVAHITVDGRSRYLGTFSTTDEAHAAYLSAKAAMHPTWKLGRKS